MAKTLTVINRKGKQFHGPRIKIKAPKPTPTQTPEKQAVTVSPPTSPRGVGEKALLFDSTSVLELLKPNKLVFVSNQDHQAKVIDCPQNSIQEIRRRQTVIIKWEGSGWHGKQAVIDLSEIHGPRVRRHRITKQTIFFPHYCSQKGGRAVHDYYNHDDEESNDHDEEHMDGFGGVPCNKYGIQKRYCGGVRQKYDSFAFDLSPLDDEDEDLIEKDDDGNMMVTMDPLEEQGEQQEGDQEEDTSNDDFISTTCGRSLARSERNKYSTYFVVEKIVDIRKTSCNALQYNIKWLNVKYNTKKCEWVFYDKLNSIAQRNANALAVHYGLYDPLSDFDPQNFLSSKPDLMKQVNVQMTAMGWSGLVSLSYTFQNKQKIKRLSANESPKHPNVICLFYGLRTTSSTFQKHEFRIIKLIKDYEEAQHFVDNHSSVKHVKIHHIHLDTRCIPYSENDPRSVTYDDDMQQEISILLRYVVAFKPNTVTMTMISKDQTVKEWGNTFQKFHCPQDRQNLKLIILLFLDLGYHVRICPLQSELYGSTQKCIRYVIYASNTNIVLCSSHSSSFDADMQVDEELRVHRLPKQLCESHTKYKNDEKRPHIKSSGQVLAHLQHGERPSEDPKHAPYPNHVILQHYRYAFGNYPQLSSAIPWRWCTEFPLRHYNEQRMLTIRELLRLLGIRNNATPIPWEELIGKDNNTTNDHPSSINRTTSNSRPHYFVLKQYQQLLRTLPVECAHHIVSAVKKSYGMTKKLSSKDNSTEPRLGLMHATADIQGKDFIKEVVA